MDIAPFLDHSCLQGVPRALRAAGRALATFLMAALFMGQATAEPLSLATELEEQVRQLALEGTRQVADNPTLGISRVDIAVGRLDPRLRLAPCEQVQPYLPAGVRLWGKARIGLRCVRGTTPWNVYLPITVKVYGQALVAASALQPGSVITEHDLAQAEVDLAENASMAITDAKTALGRTVARSLVPGQSVLAIHLKPRQWFAPGDRVKVVAVGAGFAVASQGEALTPGLEGQTARVRTENGRVLVGMPVAERQLELSL
jgi:flagella basal body P-ring formation protein FlgA